MYIVNLFFFFLIGNLSYYRITIVSHPREIVIDSSIHG